MVLSLRLKTSQLSDAHRILRVSKRMSEDMQGATQEVTNGLKRIAAMKGREECKVFSFE